MADTSTPTTTAPPASAAEAAAPTDAPPTASTPAPAAATPPPPSPVPPIDQDDNPVLTDFLDLATLQEIQDSFAAVANVKARITDPGGNLLTQPTPSKDFLSRQRAIAQAEDQQPDGPAKEGREYVAPIAVEGIRVGTLRMTANAATAGLDEAKLAALGEKFGLDAKAVRSLLQQVAKTRDTKPAAVQFLFMLANAIAKLCYQEYQLRRRIADLTAVYNATMMMSESRDLSTILNRTAKLIAEVMDCKAASIRLLDPDKDELTTRAVYNLSATYLSKGPILLSRSEIDRIALSGRGWELVKDMTTDPRVLFPAEAKAEGIHSMLCVGMRYKGKVVGVLRVYTDEVRSFPQQQIDLMRSVASQAAAAIENARLVEESNQRIALERQMKLAADVQHRMIPSRPPTVPGIDLAAIYVPCYTLGGDFYDFIELPEGNTGLAIADVSGKGVAASLIMAAVRAALRAQVDNVYYLYEAMNRVNQMVYRDTQPQEFVTAFYGVLDSRNRRLTYCNAGHPPPLVLRAGKILELESTNLVLGIDPDEPYQQHIFELAAGDIVLAYTDGLTDALNFNDEAYGKQRLVASLSQGGATANEVAQRLLWDVRKFVGISPRTDDITLVVVRVE